MSSTSTINIVLAQKQSECFNVFHILRYDIKGCEVSRWTEPAPVGSQIIVVLKDLNFEGQYINLGKERELNSCMCWESYRSVQNPFLFL